MSYRRSDALEAIERIVGLRRAERRADPADRREIADAREFLERIVGPTVRPAEAARLLGLSPPSLHRWIEEGEVPTVMTTTGRREIPLLELVRLLEEVDEARGEGVKRPLARALRDRRDRSDQAVDLNRLLPRSRNRGHRVAELNSLAYHRLVGERLDEAILDQARRRLSRWKKMGRINPRWAGEWERILEQPVAKVAKAIGADTPRARELRQTSPFAGVLTEHERQRLLEAVEERAGV
jgi:hypothetical protein